MPHRKRVIRKGLGIGLLLCIALIGQLAALVTLPYTRGVFYPVDEKVSQEGPKNGRFELGPFEWDLRSLSHAPTLEPFRKIFRQYCSGRQGRDAAMCISNWMAETIPWGTPSAEFFSSSFDNHQTLYNHIQGDPGHCVSRSWILATTLLSVGIPTRIVQMIPTRGSGHNVVEIWEQESGWTLFDPSFGSGLGHNGRAEPGIAILESAEIIQLTPPRGIKSHPGDLAHTFKYSMRGGVLVYPAPWRYLRTGPRVGRLRVFAPLTFVRVGPRWWTLGPLQEMLRIGIGIVLIALVAWSLRIVRRLKALKSLTRSKLKVDTSSAREAASQGELSFESPLLATHSVPRNNPRRSEEQPVPSTHM